MKNSLTQSLYSSPLREAAVRLVEAERKSVLLVEDTAAHAALIQRTIDPLVWQLEHVTRARAALEAFERDPQRIVLLDLSLPDSDGLKLLQQLKAIESNAPVIVCTSIDQVRVSVEAMQRGAWDYVVKADPKESPRLILEALERAWTKRLRAAENQLVEQSRLVELLRTERLEAIEGVVRTVCTEVNNPLSGVVALSQLLKARGGLGADVERLVDGIVQSASQVADVVHKLRTISSDENSNPAENSAPKAVVESAADKETESEGAGELALRTTTA